MPITDSTATPKKRGYSSFVKTTDMARIKQVARDDGLMAVVKLVASKVPSRAYWRLYHAYHLPIDRRFDRRYGVSTYGVDQLTDLTIDSPNRKSGVEYGPTPVTAFPSMLKCLPGNLQDFTFVDFGCGKGRALMLASNFDFKKIIGVEFAKELYQAAVDNVALYRNNRQKCMTIELVHSDAAEFNIPEDPCVFYFYFPFREDVMGKVLDNIVASYRRHPRQMYFINRLDIRNWVVVFEPLYRQIDFLRVRDKKHSLFMNVTFEPIEVVTCETIQAVNRG